MQFLRRLINDSVWLLCAAAAGCASASAGGVRDGGARAGVSPPSHVAVAAPSDSSPVQTPVDAQTERLYIQAVNAMRQSRDAEAERGFLAILRAQPDHTGPYANLAIIYRKQGRYGDAEKVLNEAIARNPKRVEYLNMLGILRREQGKFADAAGAYEKALEIDENYADAHYNLGILYDLYLAKYSKAARHYQAYLRLSPTGSKEVKAWLDDVNKRVSASGE